MDDVWQRAGSPEFTRRNIIDTRLALTLRHHGVTEFATAYTKHFDGFGFSRVWNPAAAEHDQDRSFVKLVADIHLHSHYSRATSKNLTLEHLWKWAQIKGVQVVATGDIAHPGWLAELRDKLEPAEAGLFRLKPEHSAALADQVPAACRGTVRFLIGGEISNIYKKYDRTRKVHNIVFAPSFDATARLQDEAGEDRQHPLRRAPDPGAGQPRPAGDRAGAGRPLSSDPGTYLDAVVLDFWAPSRASTRCRSAMPTSPRTSSPSRPGCLPIRR